MERSNDRTLIYSVIQGLFWMLFCTVIGFAAVFLLAKGFSATSIGLIIALANIAGAILQPLIAEFADRSERITLSHIIIGLSLLVMTAGFLSLTLSGAALPLVYGILIAATSILMPMVNAVGMYFIQVGQVCNYGIARAMGSLGFAGVSLFLSYFIEWFGADRIPLVSLILAALLLAVMLAVPTPIHSISSDPAAKPPRRPSALDFFRSYPGFFLFLAGVVLIFSFHNMTNTYLVQMIRHVGGADRDLGFTLFLAAMLELPAMFFFTRFQRRIKTVNIMRIAVLFFILKGVAYTLAGSVAQINGTQLLQGLSFAPFMPALVYYSSERMKPGDQIKGQAMITTANTLGGVFGNTAGGILTDQAGVPAMLTGALLLVTAGAAAVFRGLVLQKDGAAEFD